MKRLLVLTLHMPDGTAFTTSANERTQACRVMQRHGAKVAHVDDWEQEREDKHDPLGGWRRVGQFDLPVFATAR